MENFINSSVLLTMLITSFLFPGKVLSDSIIGPIKNHKIMISIILGFCFFLILSIVFYLFEWKLANLNKLTYLIIILSTIFLAKKHKINLSLLNQNNVDINAIIVFLFFLSLFYMHSNTLMVDSKNLGSDYWYYAAQSNYFVETGKLSSKLPYFNAPNSVYPFSYLFVIIALLEVNTGWSSINIINHLGSIFIILALYLNYLLLEYFIKNKVIAITSILLVVILGYNDKEGIIHTFFSYPFYPKLASLFIFFPIFTYILLNKKIFGNNYLIIVASIILLFINFHAQNSLWLMLYLFTYTSIEVVKNKKIEIDLIYLLLFSLVFISLNALLIFNLLYSEAASVFQYNPDSSSLFLSFMDMRIVNPTIYFNGLDLQLLVILSLFIFVYIKRNYVLLYSFVLLIFICLIIFNPFILNILLKIAPYFIVERFIYLLPFIFIFAYLFSEILNFIFIIYSNIQNKYKILKNIIKLSFIGIFVSSLVILIYSADKYNSKITKSSQSFFNFFKNNVEKGAFVLTDGITAYKLFAFKKINVPYVQEGFLQGHINPKDKKNIKTIFNDKVDLERKISIINSYNFNYVVINKNMKSNDFLKLGLHGFHEIFNNDEYQVLSKRLIK